MHRNIMNAPRQTGETTTKTPACYHSNLSKATKMIKGVGNTTSHGKLKELCFAARGDD